VIIFGFLTITGLISLGFRRYKGGMPIGATCSVVISAACHRPEDDIEAYLFPVQWGAIPSQILDDRASAWPSTPASTFDNSDAPIFENEKTNEEENIETIPNQSRASELIKEAKDIHESIGTAQRRLDEAEDMRVGHCCFTTHRNVSRPVEGELYK
jgi:hypothetical protein